MSLSVGLHLRPLSEPTALPLPPPTTRERSTQTDKFQLWISSNQKRKFAQINWVTFSNVVIGAGRELLRLPPLIRRGSHLKPDESTQVAGVRASDGEPRGTAMTMMRMITMIICFPIHSHIEIGVSPGSQFCGWIESYTFPNYYYYYYRLLFWQSELWMVGSGCFELHWQTMRSTWNGFRDNCNESTLLPAKWCSCSNIDPPSSTSVPALLLMSVELLSQDPFNYGRSSVDLWHLPICSLTTMVDVNPRRQRRRDCKKHGQQKKKRRANIVQSHLFIAAQNETRAIIRRRTNTEERTYLISCWVEEDKKEISCSSSLFTFDTVPTQHRQRETYTEADHSNWNVYFM